MSLSNAHPELRQDLVVKEHQVDGQAVFLMKDPTTNRFFRFVVFQYYVATLLDGQTPLETVQKRVSDRMGQEISLSGIETFVARLNDLGLLETASAQERARPERLLYYRYALLDPHRPIDWLHRRLSWCFTPTFVAGSALWILMGLWSVATDWDRYTTETVALLPLDLSILWYVYLLNMAVITVHEFAHGLACRHYGGAVQDMGFLLIYFQPAFYTDVSDSYLFDKKRARMIVMLADMYSGVLIGATAAIVWRVSEPSSSLHAWSFLVIVASCWGLLFNLNPLIKLDGYYILSDGLNIPNLRRKALALVKQRIRWVLGLPNEAVRRLKPRERKIYTLYGALAGTYALMLIALFALFVGDIAIAYAPELSLAGLAIVFAVTLRSTDSVQESALPTPLTASAWMGKPSWRTLLWIAALIAIVITLIFVKIDLRISAPFRLRPAALAVVRAEVAGQIETVYVDEGDTVRTGQVLVELSTRDLEAQLRETEAQMQRAQAELVLMQRGARAEEIQEAEAGIRETRSNLDAARLSHERTVRLAEQRLIADQELDASRTDVAVRQAAVEQAESKLRLLKSGARQEEIQARQARLVELKATHAHIEERIWRCRIASPMDGVVTTPFLREHDGPFLPQGEVVCELVDNRTLVVDMSVLEREMEEVKIDLPVEFKLNGFPSETFAGVVTAIAPVAGVEENKSVVHVRSVIQNRAGMLRPGMTGLARVNCGARPIGAILLRRIVRYVRTEFWW